MAMVRRHWRFMVALILGGAIWIAASAFPLDLALRALLALNGLFVTHIGLTLWLIASTTVDDLRRHAEVEDEGAVLILLLAVAAVAVSLAAVFLVLNSPDGGLVQSGFALLSAPLGWVLIHMLATSHYARLYYAADPDEGLDFPGEGSTDPGIWDFLYFAFTIGMTAQVSDIQVTTTAMRRVVLLHSVGAFFYNTVILALAINAGIALSG
jgi:uncharacterized membrane protein